MQCLTRDPKQKYKVQAGINTNSLYWEIHGTHCICPAEQTVFILLINCICHAISQLPPLKRHRRAATSWTQFRSRSQTSWTRSSHRRPHCWLVAWKTRWSRSERPGEGGLWYWWPDAMMTMLVIITGHNIEIRPGDGCTPLIRPDSQVWSIPKSILLKLQYFAMTAEDLDLPSKSQNIY